MNGDIHVTYTFQMEDDEARNCKDEIKRIIESGKFEVPTLAHLRKLLSDLLQERALYVRAGIG